MKAADIPQEIRRWLLDQADWQQFTIFADNPYILTVVTGGDLPHLLWDKYRAGNLKAFLDTLNYEEKEPVDERKIGLRKAINMLCCSDVDEDVNKPPD